MKKFSGNIFDFVAVKLLDQMALTHKLHSNLTVEKRMAIALESLMMPANVKELDHSQMEHITSVPEDYEKRVRLIAQEVCYSPLDITFFQRIDPVDVFKDTPMVRVFQMVVDPSKIIN